MGQKRSCLRPRLLLSGHWAEVLCSKALPVPVGKELQWPSLNPGQEGATVGYGNPPKCQMLHVPIFPVDVFELHSNSYRLFFPALFTLHENHVPTAYLSSPHSPLEYSENAVVVKLSQKQVSHPSPAPLQVRAKIRTLSLNKKLWLQEQIYLKSFNEIRLFPTSQRVIISIPTSRISHSSLLSISGSGSSYSFTHEQS